MNQYNLNDPELKPSASCVMLASAIHALIVHT